MTLEKFYDGILKKAKGKESFAANGWGSRRSQYRRFATACTELGVQNFDNILDIGCGNADLFWYLHDLGIDVTYQGIDIVPKMVELARKSLKDQPRAKVNLAEFVDNADFKFEAGYDAILCIGTVGAIEGSTDDRWSYVKELVQQGLGSSLRGMAVTFLTDRDGPKKDDGYHWYVPFAETVERMLEIVPQNVGMKVCADYHPHDVMFILKHDIF
jgi:SAM-dependent methyltransferase